MQHIGDDDEMTSEQAELWRRRMSAPDNEVPVPVAASLVLARTDDVCIAVVGIGAYTTGATVELAVRLRHRPPGFGRYGLHHVLDGWRAGEVDLAQRLLFGIEYADGRRASNVDHAAWPSGPVADDEPVLTSGGSSSSDLTHDASFWLSPLPPDGPLAFVCSWPTVGVPERRVVLEGADLTSAGARALVLWPYEPEVEPEQPPEPERPLSGWFARRRREEPTD